MNEMYYGASPEILRRARELRKNLTPSEKLLWNSIKNNQLGGVKFRRQHPVARFIVDFYCHYYRLAIEVDGEIHLGIEQSERDEGRTFELEELGLKVIRFTNQEVIKDLPRVLERIKKELTPPVLP
ncbi:hypothetical protein GCM10028791_42710 [Echinicola sediminis]